MSLNAYEIRHAILNEAREMLFEVWHEKCRNAQSFNSFSDKLHVKIPEAPTFEEVLELAKKMDAFVSNDKG